MSSALTGSVLARRSYFDLLANRAFEHQAAYPYTSDLSAGMTFNLGRHSTLSLKGLHATEGMKMTTNALEPISADENRSV